MNLFCAIVITLITFSVTRASSGRELHPLSDEFIDLINKKQNLWKAGRNFPRNTSLSFIKGLIGTLRDHHYEHLPRATHGLGGKIILPKNFDGRKHWTHCPTLYDIRDQGSCGSCWAVAAVSAMTDRYCIMSNGTKHFYFSAEDVLSCCMRCGLGCSGGMLSQAWLYYNQTGIVSGGSYSTKQGCMPYEIPPCAHNIPSNRKKCSSPVATPECQKRCESGYRINYQSDKHKSKQVYQVCPKFGIRREIYLFGPITASFNFYSDLYNYKSGIYVHQAGEYEGDHSIKIIGWGEQNTVKYWLAANSFNTDWGDNGFFKILRDENHCGIESNMVAGI